jgi:RimJ/RimL family protein N-acetyltransferase
VAGERQLADGGFLIRQPAPGDAAGYEALLGDPTVSAWLRPEPLPPFSEAEIAEMLADDLRQWRQAGFGPWVLCEAESGELVGRVGVRRTPIGDELVVELVWTVRSAWQNQNLATAAAKEGLELARSLEIEEVVALVLPANLASRRVAEKAGMRSTGEITHAGLPHLLYRIDPRQPGG